MVAWDELAGLIGEYTRKGSLVLVEGRLPADTWQPDDEPRRRVRVVADRVQFLSKATSQPEQ